MTSGRFRRLATESLWIAAGQGLAAVAAVAGVKLLTSVMEPASYGVFSLGVISATLLHSCFFGPIGAAAQRYYGPFCEEGRARVLLRVFARFSFISSIVCVVLVLLSAFGAYGAGYHSLAALSICTGVFIVFSGYIYVIDGIQNAARNRALVALHNAGFSWMRFFLAYLLVMWFGDFNWLAMAGFAIAALIIFASEWWFLSRHILTAIPAEQNLPFDTKVQREIFTFAWPFVAVGTMTWLQQSADRWALQLFRSETEVGLYSSLFQLGYAPVVMVFAMLYHTASPIVFGRAGTGADLVRVRNADRLNYLMALIFGGCVLFIFLFVLLFGEQMQLLVGPKYREVMGQLPLMVLAGGFFSIAQNLYGYFMIRGETRLLLLPTLLYSLIGCSVVFAAAWFGGLEGVVVSRIVISLLYLLFVMMMIHWFQRKRALIDPG